MKRAEALAKTAGSTRARECVRWLPSSAMARCERVILGSKRLRGRAGPSRGGCSALPQQRCQSLASIRPEAERRRLVHVDDLGHLELDGVHAPAGIAVPARDVAALEAAVEH